MWTSADGLAGRHSDSDSPNGNTRNLEQGIAYPAVVYCLFRRGQRFSFEDVRAIILRAIHPPPYEQSLDSGFGHAPVQTAAIEVLVQHGHIELLLEGVHRPEYFYNTSLEVLLDAISNQHLYSMVSLLEAIIERASDEHSVIRAAWVLADLDYTSQAQEVIEGLIQKRLTHGWVAHDIMQGIHRLPAPYALDVVDEILSTVPVPVEDVK